MQVLEPVKGNKTTILWKEPGLNLEKSDFVQLMVDCGALQFGSFTLKSGRTSPYFFNAARFRTAIQLSGLGEHYAAAIQQSAPKATVIFGPAYKGIPLCITSAIALARQTKSDVGYLFNRKEEKTHGDKGLFVGQQPTPEDRLVIVDDVITDGETKREAVALLREAFDTPIDALVIAFDRMEKGPGGENALKDFENMTGIPVIPILTLADLQKVMESSNSPVEASKDNVEAIIKYREQYGL